MSIYHVIWFFMIYSVIGWLTEVVYAAVQKGKFVNRGFLNGPYCPIYGMGILVVLMILFPIRHEFLLLFIGSVLLTSAIELVTGFLLEVLFHNKWWDYSKNAFNLWGYVCLKFSLFWGISCMLIVLILHPLIQNLVNLIPRVVGLTILIPLSLILFSDTIVTVMTILKFNRTLRLMDEVALRLKLLSNDLGESIYVNVMGAVEFKTRFSEEHEDVINGFAQKKDKFTTNVENQYEKINQSVKQALRTEVLEAKKDEYQQLLLKYKGLVEKKTYGQLRLLKAFPGMISINSNESLQKLRQELKKYRKSEKK